ncbi:MAG: hypothetical protein ACOCUI_00490 [bacterium]
MARITVSNLLKEVIDTKKETLETVQNVSKAIEDYANDFRTARITIDKKIISFLNDALAVLGGDRFSQSQLESAVLDLIEQLNRKHPLPDLTEKYLMQCQKALSIAITGHFSALEQIQNMLLLSIIGNTSLLKNSSLVSEDFVDALDEVKDVREVSEEHYS